MQGRPGVRPRQVRDLGDGQEAALRQVLQDFKAEDTAVGDSCMGRDMGGGRRSVGGDSEALTDFYCGTKVCLATFKSPEAWFAHLRKYPGHFGTTKTGWQKMLADKVAPVAKRKGRPVREPNFMDSSVITIDEGIHVAVSSADDVAELRELKSD